MSSSSGTAKKKRQGYCSCLTEIDVLNFKIIELLEENLEAEAKLKLIALNIKTNGQNHVKTCSDNS
jgi:hypothetical protein